MYLLSDPEIPIFSNSPLKLCVSLLVASHACLIVDSSFAFIAKRLVGIVDDCELLLGLRCLVHVRMVLFREVEVCFLDVGLGRTPINSERLVEVILPAAAAEVPSE